MQKAKCLSYLIIILLLLFTGCGSEATDKNDENNFKGSSIDDYNWIEWDEVIASESGYTKSNTVNIYELPDTESNVIANLESAEKIYIIDSHNGWCKILTDADIRGFIRENDITNTPPQTEIAGENINTRTFCSASGLSVVAPSIWESTEINGDEYITLTKNDTELIRISEHGRSQLDSFRRGLLEEGIVLNYNELEALYNTSREEQYKELLLENEERIRGEWYRHYTIDYCEVFDKTIPVLITDLGISGINIEADFYHNFNHYYIEYQTIAEVYENHEPYLNELREIAATLEDSAIGEEKFEYLSKKLCSKTWQYVNDDGQKSSVKFTCNENDAGYGSIYKNGEYIGEWYATFAIDKEDELYKSETDKLYISIDVIMGGHYTAFEIIVDFDQEISFTVDYGTESYILK